jgi:hypothetical protein
VKLVLKYQGFEICRTSAGHLVVLHPACSRVERAELVELLADAGSLDALFFPSVDDAFEAIDQALAFRVPHR